MRILQYSIVFGEALLLSAGLIPLIIKLALKWNVVDNPGARKVHKTPKPLMGGVGIFIAFFVTIVANIIGFYLLRSHPFVQSHFTSIHRLIPFLQSVLPKLVILLGGGFLMHMVGLVDDVFKENMKYQPKFIAQIIIAILVALGGVRIQFLPGTLLNIIFTVVWIVGITNSFNLLDNMDGLTAGVSLIAGMIFLGISVVQGQVFIAFILAALMGGVLGFLVYNFPPSKLFMGDSGSLFLGFMFGTLTVLGSYVTKTSTSHLSVLMPVLILSIPLYDTFSVMYIRWREKRPLFIGDKRHFSHRLLALGLKQKTVVIFIYLLCFCIGITSTLLPYITLAGEIIILAQAIIIYTLITFLIITGSNKNSNS